MNAMTPWKVLFGNRQAILDAASSRWTLLVGALLVLSASLARKYDTVDLLAVPHELLHGFAATVVNVTVLHSMLWVAQRIRGRERPAFWSSWLSFLGVFWLAAPMGWLYGIPYEQWMSGPQAIACNLWTLAAVSLLRVVWVTRVLAVLWGVESKGALFQMFCIVMLYSDAVAVVALMTMPLPTFDFMGGLQQSAEERIVAGAAFQSGCIGLLTAPIWLIGGLSGLKRGPFRWSVAPGSSGRSIAALLVPMAACVGWSLLLPVFQPQQQHRTAFEGMVDDGRVEEAVAAMALRTREDYPRAWTPPHAPKNDNSHRDERLSNLMAELERINAPAWMTDLYIDAINRELARGLRFYGRRSVLENLDARTKRQFFDYEHQFFDESSEWFIQAFVFLRDRPSSLQSRQRAAAQEWLDTIEQVRDERAAATQPATSP